MVEREPNTLEKFKTALQSKDQNQIDKVVYLIEPSFLDSETISILNELLTDPNHRSHQRVIWLLQKAKSPSTVPYIKRALETNFDYLEYTYSESGVIAKWFSWALAEIGTEQAILLMKEYTNSPDEGIKNQMLYRLNKIQK